MRIFRIFAKRGVSQNAIGPLTMSGVMARAGLWMAITFVLNMTWEIAQVRLYTLWAEADGVVVAWALLHCTLGDVAIALAMFAVAAIMLWCTDWPVLHPWIGGAVVVIGAMAFTAWSEWYNVYRAGNWAYTASMPTIFGVGLAPLLQWLILPPLLVLAYRHFGALRSGRRSLMQTQDFRS